MVAVIKTGQSVRQTFHYNENKVSMGDAIGIGQGNYPVDFDQMSTAFKVNMLCRQLQLNENVTRGSVHISLNFHPSEKNLTPEKLMDIAKVYMREIGFEEQPYLVYQHFDAAHPHIHLISVKVRADGTRIDMQNIGKNQSEKARIKIENDFELIKAQGREKQPLHEVKPIAAAAVRYGKIQSKKAMSQVLDHVIGTYLFKTLPQLNAVLNLYNVRADRGEKDSRIFKSGGLVYRIVNADGQPVGVPIKASDFHSRPTLKFLEKRFEQNTLKNPRPGLRIKNEIRSIFLSSKPSLKELSRELENQGITMVKRTAENGSLYGLTYIDHVTKQICNGSELGKEFAAAGILQQCLQTEKQFISSLRSSDIKLPEEMNSLLDIRDILASKNFELQGVEDLLMKLFQREYPDSYVPAAFKKKKSRRKGLSNN